MFYIENNGIIRITRGDSAEAPLFINKGTELCPIRYRLNDNSRLYFNVMQPNYPFEHPCITKKYSNKDENENGDIVIQIDTEDTINLIPGKYYYEIKVNEYDEQKDKYRIYTVVDRTQFFIEG